MAATRAPPAYIRHTMATRSGATLIRRPFRLSPQVLPEALAAACPARLRSARSSVSNCATEASTCAVNLPPGVDRSRLSLMLTSPTWHSFRSSKIAVSPFEVRPKRSSRHTTTRATFPISITVRSRFHPGQLMVRPVNLSRYHWTGISLECTSAHLFRSSNWLRRSCWRDETLT